MGTQVEFPAMDIIDNETFDDDTPAFEEAEGAPRYPIPSRELSAVEVPAIINNIDRAVKAFGRVPDLSHVSRCCLCLTFYRS